MHKGLDVFLKDLGVFLKAERVLKKDLGLFWGGGCCMKYHQLNTLFYVSLQLIVKQSLNPLIRVKRAFVFLL